VFQVVSKQFHILFHILFQTVPKQFNIPVLEQFLEQFGTGIPVRQPADLKS